MSVRKSGRNRRKRLGEMLLEAGLIDEMQLAVALGEQKQWGGKLGAELLRLGFVAERELALVLEEQLGIRWIQLFDRDIPEEVLRLVPADLATSYLVIPVEYDGKTLTLAATNPMDLEVMDTLQFLLGKRIRPLMALEPDIIAAIVRHYGLEGTDFEASMEKKWAGWTVRTEGAGRTARMPGSSIPSRRCGPHPPQSGVAGAGHPSLSEALVKLLLRKNLITEKELLEEFRRMDASP
ncbi:MAG: hypothetical protein P8Y75_03595 [Nitrospirota bacterium]|jgi:hypothetical protein